MNMYTNASNSNKLGCFEFCSPGSFYRKKHE